jgi:MOSC domain-containing protein YiiM
LSAAAEGGLARCVEHILGTKPGALPASRDALGEELARRGFALAIVAEPGSFSMPGAFLARRRGGWTVDFGVPPGTIHDPNGAAGSGQVVEAAVLVNLDLGIAAVERPDSTSTRGRVAAIAIAAEAEAPARALERVRAVAGSGLEGDRYAAGTGTFSANGGTGRDLTLVEAEALAELREHGVELCAIEARRNLVVEDIDLDRLIGRRFLVGEVECRGARRCEPCAHLERLTQPGVLRGLVHRGGLRADVLSGGWIGVGDEIRLLED